MAPRNRAEARALDATAIEVALGIISAETWPARYKLHKYWGRKPANVVARYLELFSKPGEVVLDPFAGSGVTVIEAARLGRAPVGFDLNPFAVRLTRAMLTPPDPRAFEQAARDVVARAERAVGHLYLTTCDGCGKDARLRSMGYVGEQAREVRYRCGACGHSGSHAPTARDLTLSALRPDAPDDTPDSDILFGWEMQKLRRGGVKRWRDLFTQRNFCAAGELRRAILTIEDAACREWLLLSLTASLAQFTRMIADSSGKAGGPSWKINCYWLPSKWQELNPIWYFENRVKKSHEAARDLIKAGAPFSCARAENIDSRRLPLADESVDYIFTDPPYGGEGIQYGELSLLWCLWLSEAEVAFNPYRKLDQQHYASGLARVFSECFRVLREGKWMTVTFANKDPIVWDALLSACRSAGFSLVTAAPMKRSAPSLTETNMHTAPKADLVLTFQKPLTADAARSKPAEARAYSLEHAVARIITAMQESEIPITPHHVFDRVTVDWFSWFYEGGARPEAVQPTLARVAAAMQTNGVTPPG